MKFKAGQLVSIPTVTVHNGDRFGRIVDARLGVRSVGIVRAYHETKNGWYEVYCTHNECMVHMPKSSLRLISTGDPE